MALLRHKVDQHILARRVIRPVDLAPAHVDLVRPALAQRVLPEEEHEPGAVLVQRAALLLDQPDALDDVDQLDLLVARQLRDADARELLVDLGGGLLVERRVPLVVRHAPGEVLTGVLERGRLR